MKPNKKRYWIGFGALVLISGVALVFLLKPSFEEPPPRWAMSAAPPESGRSTLMMPLTVHFSELEQRFDGRFPTILVDEIGKDLKNGFLLDLKVSRTGKLQVEAEGNNLVTSVPMLVDARIYNANRAQRREKRGKSAPEGATVSAALIVQVNTKISIDPSWGLIETSSTITHRWLSVPQLQAGTMVFNIEQQANTHLLTKWPEIAQKIDFKVEQKDLLRPKLEIFWDQLSAPRQLNELPPIWLLGNIDALYSGDPTFDRKGMVLHVGLSGFFRIFLGQPEAISVEQPLLPRSKPPEDLGFNLALSAELQWDTLSQLATSALSTQSFPLIKRRGTLTVSKVLLYPSGNKIVVAVHYHADLPVWDTEGIIYLVGTPVLDEVERVLRVTDFHYVLRTWDDWLAGVNAIAKVELKERIQERLVFPFGDRLDQATEQINEGLQNSVQKRGTINGQMDSFTLSGIRLTDTGVIIDATIFGKLAMKMDLPATKSQLK